MTKPQSWSALSFVVPPAPKASRAQGICWNQLKPSMGIGLGLSRPRPNRPSPPSPPHPFQTDLRAPRRKTDANTGERTRSQGRGLPQPREAGRLGHVSRVAGGSISRPQENFSLMEGLESYPWSGGAVLKRPDLVARGCSHVCPSRLSACRPWALSPGSSSLQRPSQAALGQCRRQFLHASCPPLGPRPLTMLQHQP